MRTIGGWAWSCIVLFIGCGPGTSSPPAGSGTPPSSSDTPAPPPPAPAGSALIAVSFTGKGGGHVTSTPAGIDCPGACSMTVAAGASVSLTEQPDASSTFVGWGGGCSGSNGCNLTATADKTVWVHFEPQTPPASSCAGIAAPDAVVMQEHVHEPMGHYFHCGPGAADASGTLAFTYWYSDPAVHGDGIDFVSPANSLLGQDGTTQGLWAVQQPAGLTAVSGPPYLGPLAGSDAVAIANYDSSGKATGNVFLYAKSHAIAADPAGGVLFAGDLATSNSDPSARPALAHAAAMFSGGGTAPSVRWGPQPLASTGTVFGAGVDTLGRALVITDGTAKFGDGNVSAQWFDRNGTALTGEFVLLTSFVAGSATWFEASPLIGGGLVVRRIDGGAHSQALVVVASGAASVERAPEWMAARTDARLQIARGGRAYAVLPYGAKGVACSQRIEVVSPDGASCGTRDYPIANGTCDTHDLSLGANGTVIQQLPDSMETKDPIASTQTCTWRFWPAAAK